ncbi:hypothetical protein Bca52824_085145 [Brassica carinata]|uniref:Uncharacterized protein n=1 Tax=Brassica carinata TaxID=52824 RepID=A0A8X7P7M0_BRACI|nr:hypothetical protein Bca52824_085145 [Brassica carinata]
MYQSIELRLALNHFSQILQSSAQFHKRKTPMRSKGIVNFEIDPVTHKHKNETLMSSTGQSKSASAALSHMAQWESARLEAEARLARESKLLHLQHYQNNNKAAPPNHCLSHKASTNWTKPNQGNGDQQLESPTSTVTFSENHHLMIMPSEENNNVPNVNEFAVSSSTSSDVKDSDYDWMKQINCQTEGIEEGFTSLLLLGDSGDRSLSTGKKEEATAGAVAVNESDYSYYEDNKNYWNSILNLVDSTPSDSSTMF